MDKRNKKNKKQNRNEKAIVTEKAIAAEKPIKSNYFAALTGVRAIAAYMVFLLHYNPFNPKVIGKPLYDFARELHIGVTMFFVLSGFLIAYHYSDLKEFRFKKYLINRIARIYPVYFILTTFTFLVFINTNTNTANLLNIYLLNISFLRGFFDDFKFTGIAPGWSLTIEETFYFSAPLFFLLLNRSKYYFVVLPLCLLSLGVGLVLVFSKLDFYGFFNTFEFMFRYTFLGRCSEFFIGMALAFFLKQQVNRPKFKYFTLLGILGIIVSVYIISLYKGNFDYGIRHPVGKVLNTLVLPVFGIVPFFYGLITEKTWLSALLGSKLFVLLGKSSYVFYLIHMGVISMFLHKYSPSILLLFLELNLVAMLIFKFIEEPLNLFIRKKLVA